MVGLFWPLVLETSNFTFNEEKEPVFLTYEVAQYFMAKLVSPLLDQGFFAELRLVKNRLYSQLLDNLNKATVNQIPLDQVHEYLRSDSGTDATRRLLFDDISRTINAYRAYTVQHNLLDFSLYNEVFWELFSQEPEVQAYMSRQFRHVIYDNAEEDFPLAHAIVRAWIPALESCMIISDLGGGYRKFLGANPESAADPENSKSLRSVCPDYLYMDENRHTPEHLMRLGSVFSEAIQQKKFTREELPLLEKPGFYAFSNRLHHNMVDQAIKQVIQLVEDGVPPGDISVISPFLTDSLRIALVQRLDQAGIASFTHKPSRILKDKPIAKVLMAITLLAHPQWKAGRPSSESVTHMLSHVIESLDLVRATLLVSSVYEPKGKGIGLREFDRVPADLRDRITYSVGEKYDQFREWLEAYRTHKELPIDHFLSRLFGELLSQRGYGLFQDEEAGIEVATVVESARKFRQAVSGVHELEGQAVGKAYIDMVQEGVMSAYYSANWRLEDDAVLLSPVHTFSAKKSNISLSGVVRYQ